MDELIKFGIKVFGNKKMFYLWLVTSNKVLKNRTPFDILINDNDTDILITILRRIEYGVYS